MTVKQYSLSLHKDYFCSPHTQVKELRCKSGANTVLVSEELMIMIEKLFSKLQCSKYIISSGYRTPEYSVKIGGTATDQHTKGKAVDACFYDKNGKIISAKVVCCVAQDLGFRGIANISNRYQYVHLDVRDTGLYYGDEIKGTNTVTDNFYKYFNLTKADIAKYTGETTVTYFAKFTGTTNSIVTGLKSIGENSSYIYRCKIAKVNGITGYRGSGTQNTTMLNLLKQGKLIKP